MSCVIEHADVVNCGCGCEPTVLVNPDNDARINKAYIQSYRKIDAIPNYDIEFIMRDGMIQVWTFTTMAARDAALANIDTEMNAKTM